MTRTFDTPLSINTALGIVTLTPQANRHWNWKTETYLPQHILHLSADRVLINRVPYHLFGSFIQDDDGKWIDSHSGARRLDTRLGKSGWPTDSASRQAKAVVTSVLNALNAGTFVPDFEQAERDRLTYIADQARRERDEVLGVLAKHEEGLRLAECELAVATDTAPGSGQRAVATRLLPSWTGTAAELLDTARDLAA